MKNKYEKPMIESEPAFETLAGCSWEDPEDPSCFESPGLNANPQSPHR